MRAWYTANGLIEPEYYRRVVLRRERAVENPGGMIERHIGRRVP